MGLALLTFSAGARAQSIQTDNTAVLRFAIDSDAELSPRPTNENPTGISFADCADDIDVQFTLDISAAPADAVVQVWAGPGDCVTNAAAREPGSSSFGRCWQVAPTTAFPLTGSSTTTGRVHVRDIVAYLGQSAPPATYAPATSVSVCKPATAASVVPLNVVFMFVAASSVPTGDAGTAAPYIGTPAQYTMSAALVGPFEPQSFGVVDGGISSGTLAISWTPQSEATIQGYNIYYQDLTASGSGAVDASSTLETQILCPQKVACTSTGDAALDAGCDAGTMLVVDNSASLRSLSDASLASMGCERQAARLAFDAASSGTGGATCQSSALFNTFTVDGGLGVAASTSTTPEPTGFVDSGVDSGLGEAGGGDSGSTVVVVNPTTTSTPVYETAGISNIPGHYLYQYVAGATTSSFQLSGLTNNHTYAITVAAVDGSGNVGPVAALACAAPEPVTDFFSAYQEAGGQAGGGYCTVVGAGAPAVGSLFGVAVAGALVALSRRRRRRR
jgi:hypothetical protein